MEKIALISDIHSNVWALEVVLNHIASKGVNRILNLGDTLYGSIDPLATAKLIMDQSIHSLCGNQDRVLFQPNANATANPSLQFTQKSLRTEVFEWLSGLPSTIQSGQRFLAFHGTPDDDESYLIEEISNGIPKAKSENQLCEILGPHHTFCYFCGHSHLPGLVKAGSSWIINPGSVGLPSYVDDWPLPHTMQTGSPHARYALVYLCGDTQVEVEQIALTYPWQKAAEQARCNGRPEWERYLLTGRVD